VQDSFSVGKHFSAHPNRCRLESWLKSLLRKAKLSGMRGRERDGAEVDVGREARVGAAGAAGELSGAEELRGPGL